MAHSKTGLQFIEAVRYLFKQSGFESQKALAYTAGVSQSVINDILKKRKAYGPKTQEKIASAFNRDLIELLAIGRDRLNAKKTGQNKKMTTTSSEKRSIKGCTHEEIIALFNNKDWARRVTSLLLEIEQDSDQRKIAENIIEAIAAQTRTKKK